MRGRETKNCVLPESRAGRPQGGQEGQGSWNDQKRGANRRKKKRYKKGKAGLKISVERSCKRRG